MIKQFYHESYLDLKDLRECLKNKTEVYISSHVLSNEVVRNYFCEFYNDPFQIVKIEARPCCKETFNITFQGKTRFLISIYEDGYYHNEGGYDKKIVCAPFFCIRGKKTWGNNLDKIIEMLQNYNFSQIIEGEK